MEGAGVYMMAPRPCVLTLPVYIILCMEGCVNVEAWSQSSCFCLCRCVCICFRVAPSAGAIDDFQSYHVMTRWCHNLESLQIQAKSKIQSHACPGHSHPPALAV